MKMRYQSLDLLRGIAIVLMVIFHFCFDLAWFGVTQQNFYVDPFWLHSRTVILSAFLFTVGLSFALQINLGMCQNRYIRRQGYLLVCAIIISISSWYYATDRMIFFGVLHFILLASLLNILIVKLRLSAMVCMVLGVIVVIAGNAFSHEFFHYSYLKWIGFQQFKPSTDDYVPVFPWYGVVLTGFSIGVWLIQQSKLLEKTENSIRGLPTDFWVVILGKYSLAVYMIHQPLLIALIFIYTRTFAE